MPKISEIEIFKANLPFKHSFKHSLKSRFDSESVFVKILLDNGVAGFGESLPRSYVTGNTQDSALKDLNGFASRLIGISLDSESGSIGLIKDLAGIEDEARCALEIALLDCLGRVCSKPISAFLGNIVNNKFTYSMVVPSTSMVKTAIVCGFARVQGYKFIKVKVGSGNDVAAVRLCRRFLPDADIRIDVNGAWDTAQALSMIEKLRPFRISCVEQPVPKASIDALAEVADFCPEPIMADESLCTKSDAIKLAETRACDMFNVRLSKCGGIFRSMDIIRIADDHGISYQIGCLVGESGILSAAARHMASVLNNVKYFEGSYSRFLLKEDVIEEDLTPRKSIGYTLNGSGLGVTVKENIIRKYSTGTIVVK